MIKFFLRSSEIDIRSFINQVLFYIRRVPGLKWLSTSSTYKMNTLKEFAIFFSPIFSILIKIAKTVFLLFWIMLTSFYFQSFIFKNLSFGEIFLRLGSGFLVYSVLNPYLEEEREKLIVFYELFNINPKKVILSDIFIRGFLHCIGMILILNFIGSLLKINFRATLSLGILLYLITIIYNAFYTFISEKGFKKFSILDGINFLAIAVLVLMSFVFNINLEVFLTNRILTLMFLILALISGYYLYKYDKYTQKLLELDFEDKPSKFKSAEENLADATVLKSGDLEVSKEHIGKNLNGYNLLNELFFQRHRRILLKPIRIKTTILLIVLIIFTVAISGYLPIFDIDLADLIEKAFEFLPGILPFAAYIIFQQELLTKTMFINCDQALMQYGFYRRPNDLLKMFSLRLKKLLLWNSLPLGIIILWLMILKLLLSLDIFQIGIIILQIISLWLFFSVHTLFIYYLFQPYNDAYELKHPIYKFINWFVYFVCYMSLTMRPSGRMVAPVFITAAVIYSVVALMLVYKKAPDTFKLRISK